MPSFNELYAARFAAGKYVCVGLDPDIKQIPDCVPGDTDAERVLNYLKITVNVTHEFAGTYKLQSAYYEALGDEGPAVLRQVIEHIRSVDPTIPIILDYKRGDIGRTNDAYVSVAFAIHMVDAVTVHPYLGKEAMQPFLDCADKTIFVLCRTSNKGAGEFQDVPCTVLEHSETGKFYSTEAFAAFEGVTGDFSQVVMPLYQFVAHRVAQSWNTNGNCALVVGATYPGELAEVRSIVGDEVSILIPGLGTQQGDLSASINNGVDGQGGGIVLNNSSAILFAYKKLKLEDSDELKYTPEEHAAASAEATRIMNEAAATVLAA